MLKDKTEKLALGLFYYHLFHKQYQLALLSTEKMLFHQQSCKLLRQSEASVRVTLETPLGEYSTLLKKKTEENSELPKVL